MNKKLLLLLTLCFALLLCGCKSKHETIDIYGKENMVFDNININLKEGYWVKDYQIDYDNMQVILNLEVE